MGNEERSGAVLGMSPQNITEIARQSPELGEMSDYALARKLSEQYGVKIRGSAVWRARQELGIPRYGKKKTEAQIIDELMRKWR